jgi:hypothetical protein
MGFCILNFDPRILENVTSKLDRSRHGPRTARTLPIRRKPEVGRPSRFRDNRP